MEQYVMTTVSTPMANLTCSTFVLSPEQPVSIIPLQRRRMALVSHIGFDLVARQHFV